MSRVRGPLASILLLVLVAWAAWSVAAAVAMKPIGPTAPAVAMKPIAPADAAGPARVAPPRGHRAPLAAAGAPIASAALAVAAGSDAPAPPVCPAPSAASGAVPGATEVLVSAVFADGFAPDDADEAVQLWNVGAGEVDIGGWSVGDGEGTAAFPSGAALAAGQYVWLARDAAAFARSFGHAPDWAWSAAGADVPRMPTTGGGPGLANSADEVELRRSTGAPVDAVVYGGSGVLAGWRGPGVRPYRTASIAAAHQVLWRKLDPATGQPVADTDTAADWASDPDDPLLGRRPRYPGWDVERAAAPRVARDRGTIEVVLAPDGLFAFLMRYLASAQVSIDLEVYTFENADLAEVVADRAASGVRVRVLVEGAPVGGVSLAERWCLARIAAGGGMVYFLDTGGDVRARYLGAHAKVAVIDDRVVLIGSENPGPGAAPSDDPSDGTAGRRGVYAATDAPAVVGWARDLVARDIDAVHHVDLRPFQPRDPARGAPPADFIPARGGGGAGYAPRFADPLVTDGTLSFELVTAPENAVAPGAGLLGMVGRAGPADAVLVEQLSEPVWWGGGPDDGDVARSPRVQAYLDAARRGARVRVLLDGHFDDPAAWNGNSATVRYLNAAATAGKLDLVARLGNPTGLGIHNKMVLVGPWSSDRGSGTVRWVHLGSLNGTEVASKANREVALQIASDGIHAHLATVFAFDWATTNALWLPWLGGRSVLR